MDYYQNYITQGNNPEITHFYRQKKLLSILGSDQFKKQLSKEEIGLIETSRGQGGRNLPRWVAMKLCQQCGEAKLTDIAREFHELLTGRK